MSSREDPSKNHMESSETRNFIRLQHALMTVGSEYLRNLFKEKWSLVDLSPPPWNDNERLSGHILTTLLAGTSLLKNSKSHQKELLARGQLQLWDIPLIIHTLKAINPKIPKGRLLEKDIQALDSLKTLRNQLAHAPSQKVSNDVFEEHMRNLKRDFTQLNTSPEQLAHFDQETRPKSQELLEGYINYTETLEKAAEFTTSNNLRKAIELYGAAIEKGQISSEDLANLYFLRGSLYYSRKSLEEAKKDAKSVVVLAPSTFQGYSLLARIYDGEAKYDKALANYSTALLYSPQDSRLLEGKHAMIYRIQKDERREYLEPMLNTFIPPAESGQRYTSALELIRDHVGPRLEASLKRVLPRAMWQCYEAGKYLIGSVEEGYPQNYEKAAELFSQAARAGSAEGLYHLGVLLQEGKGVARDVIAARDKFRLAAELPPKMELIPGSGKLERNYGVGEAQFALGLIAQEGRTASGEKDFKEAIKWYTTSLGSGYWEAGMNLAILYENGSGFPRPDFSRAVQLWELAAVNGCLRAVHNLIYHYVEADVNPVLARSWLEYSKTMEGASFLFSEEEKADIESFPCPNFQRDAFLQGVQGRVASSPYAHLLLKRDAEPSIPQFQSLSLHGGRKEELIIWFRTCFKKLRTKSRMGGGQPVKVIPILPKTLPKPLDLIGLEVITLKEIFTQQQDVSTYDKRLLKLNVIEDLTITTASITTLVEDEDGEVERLAIYGYRDMDNAQEEIGYGARIIIVVPTYKRAGDGKYVIRVDNPDTIIKQGTGGKEQRCRFCGKRGKTGIECRKCRRVSYCSKVCLKKDAEELQHGLICFKKI